MMRVYGIVYSPDKVDLQGDTATAETIRKAEQTFMKQGRLKNIDTNHQFAKVQAFVTETWIVKASDPMFPNDEGAWAVGIKIEDEALWKGLQDGKLLQLNSNLELLEQIYLFRTTNLDIIYQ